MKAKKPVNEDIGQIACPFCGRSVPVRRNAGGKLYFLCDFRRAGTGGCGMVTPNLNDGQDWIREHMREVSATPAPVAPPVIDAPQEPVVTAPAPAAPPVKVNEPVPGIFSQLMSARIL